MAHTFADFKVATPDLAEVRVRVADLVREVENAVDGTAVVAAVGRWDQLRWMLYRCQKLPLVRRAMDTKDAEQLALKNELGALSPSLEALERQFTNAVLNSPLQHQAEVALGTPVMDRWRQRGSTFSEFGAVEDGAHVDACLTAFAQPPIGQAPAHSWAILAARSEYAPTEPERADACRQMWAWVSKQSAPLRDQLVRSVSSGRWQHASPDHMALLDVIREQLASRLTALRAEQAQNLDVAAIQPWNEHTWSVAAPLNLPTQTDAALDLALAAFHALAPEIAQGLDALRQLEVVDLEDRPHKMICRGCNTLFGHKEPFLFGSLGGGRSDIAMLAHQMGHVLQWCEVHGWWRAPKPPLLDGLWAPDDVSEVHGYGLQLLVLPHLDAWVGTAAATVRRAMLADLLSNVVETAALAAFEGVIHQHPEWSAADFDGCWRDVEAAFMPWRQAGNIPHLVSGKGWQRHTQLLTAPRSNLAHLIGVLGALELAAFPDALSRYRALCRRGHAGSSTQMFTDVGLTHPLLGAGTHGTNAFDTLWRSAAET